MSDSKGSQHPENIRRFQAGEVIFRAGDPGHCAYLIQAGRVRIQTPDDHKPVAFLGRGELLGDMAILDDSPRLLTAVADTDCTLMVIQRNQFLSRLKQADPVIRTLVEVLLNRLRKQVQPEIAVAGSGFLQGESTGLHALEGLEKIQMEADLLQALEADGIEMAFQPLVNLKTHQVAGFEALCRWHHDSLGAISPGEFIALAEETDLIVPLGIRIFKKACAFLRQLDEAFSEQAAFFMSINVSPRQLAEPDFIQKIRQITRDNALSPRRIKLEITETLMMDYHQARQLLQPLHAMGFTLSLDDFGTGYSGLQHLIELDFKTLKIDQGFVASMFENERSLALINIITDMAANMDIEVVAEGIEDQQQKKVLQALGVDYGQGYLFSPPLSAEAALDYVRRTQAGVKK